MARKINIIEVTAKSALSKSGLPELDYALNPYMGCMHSCVYCFAIDFTSNAQARNDWGGTVAVRTNIIDVLRREVKTARRGIVGVSTITDPYQAIEGRYRLTRNAVKLLAENGFRVSIQTKSPLVARDMDILTQHPHSIDVGMTVTTMDEKAWKLIEPGSPSPASRLKALSSIQSGGVKTWIFFGPILKGVNDTRESIERVIEKAAGIGTRIIYDRYKPYRGSSELIKKIGLNISDFSRTPENDRWWQSTRNTIESLCDSMGVTCTYQPEEWKYERNANYGSIFRDTFL
ncbi:MAG: SPL family radical SAM protein [Thermoplasmataceae archaeon]